MTYMRERGLSRYPAPPRNVPNQSSATINFEQPFSNSTPFLAGPLQVGFHTVNPWLGPPIVADLTIRDAAIALSRRLLLAALPLAGTGMGLMGFVGWWRKRRGEAVVSDRLGSSRRHLM